MSDNLVSLSTAPVNASPPARSEEAEAGLRKAVASALADVEIMLDWTGDEVAAVVSVVEKARGAASATDDLEGVNELDAIGVALNAIQNSLVDARRRFEAIPLAAD